MRAGGGIVVPPAALAASAGREAAPQKRLRIAPLPSDGDAAAGGGGGGAAGKPLRFRFPPAPRMGDAYAVAELVGLGHGYEGGGRAGEARRLFSDVSLQVGGGP